MSANFIVYDATGQILRTGRCSREDLEAQAQLGEYILEGIANDLMQKIVDGKVVNKTPEEIAASGPPVVPLEKLPASITMEQWQTLNATLTGLLDRISKVEARLKP
jgi:hypothetical protein